MQEITEGQHTDIVRALQVTQEPAGLLSASEDGKVIFWTATEEGFEVQNSFDLESNPHDITVTLTGAKVFIHCENDVVELNTTEEKDNFELVGQ